MLVRATQLMECPWGVVQGEGLLVPQIRPLGGVCMCLFGRGGELECVCEAGSGRWWMGVWTCVPPSFRTAPHIVDLRPPHSQVRMEPGSCRMCGQTTESGLSILTP